MSTVQKKSSGFTLIELMMVIVIVAILATLAAPSFSRLILSQRLKTASFDLQAALVLARSEAIKRNADVVLEMANTSGTWADGWNVKVVSGSLVIKRQSSLSSIQFSPSTSDTKLTYQRDGKLKMGTAGSMGSDGNSPYWRLSVTGDSTIAGRCIEVDRGGRINVKTDSDGDISNGC